MGDRECVNDIEWFRSGLTEFLVREMVMVETNFGADDFW